MLTERVPVHVAVWAESVVFSMQNNISNSRPFHSIEVCDSVWYLKQIFYAFAEMKIKGCGVNVCQIATAEMCSSLACMVLVMPDKYHADSSGQTI